MSATLSFSEKWSPVVEGVKADFFKYLKEWEVAHPGESYRSRHEIIRAALDRFELSGSYEAFNREGLEREAKEASVLTLSEMNQVFVRLVLCAQKISLDVSSPQAIEAFNRTGWVSAPLLLMGLALHGAGELSESYATFKKSCLSLATDFVGVSRFFQVLVSLLVQAETLELKDFQEDSAPETLALVSRFLDPLNEHFGVEAPRLATIREEETSSPVPEVSSTESRSESDLGIRAGAGGSESPAFREENLPAEEPPVSRTARVFCGNSPIVPGPLTGAKKKGRSLKDEHEVEIQMGDKRVRMAMADYLKLGGRKGKKARPKILRHFKGGGARSGPRFKGGCARFGLRVCF